MLYVDSYEDKAVVATAHLHIRVCLKIIMYICRSKNERSHIIRPVEQKACGCFRGNVIENHTIAKSNERRANRFRVFNIQTQFPFLHT